MNKKVKFAIILGCLLISASIFAPISSAQTVPPPPPEMTGTTGNRSSYGTAGSPIDSGVIILILSASAFAARRYYLGGRLPCALENE